MKIGIITAMPEENGAVIRAIQPAQKIRVGDLAAQQGRVNGHEVTVVEAGMGYANAAAAARQLFSGQRPELLISAGFCGGISAELKVGDAVLAAEVMTVSENGLQKVPFISQGDCRDLLSHQTGDDRRLFSGLFACTTAIMPKSRLAELLPPDAPYAVVEMESGAIAGIASENGIPFIGLRTVSDPFDEELAFSLDEFCDRQMKISIPRVLLSVARRPRMLPQLIRLAHNSRIAADSLSLVVARFLAAV